MAVVVVTSIVFTAVAVVAPLLAGDPPTELTPGELRSGDVGGSRLAAPRLRTGLDAVGNSPDPTHRRTFSPDPTIEGETVEAVSPTSRPPLLVAFMNVSRRKVKTGDHLVYKVTVTNIGGLTYRGAFTINTHTPEGTLRCQEESSDVCATPGEYDGASDDPNDPHVNPSGTTKTVSLGPGEVERLLVMEVVVAAVSGSVLYNHAHVDGVGKGNGSATVKPGQVGVATSGAGGQYATAPEVLVVG